MMSNNTARAGFERELLLSLSTEDRLVAGPARPTK